MSGDHGDCEVVGLEYAGTLAPKKGCGVDVDADALGGGTVRGGAMVCCNLSPDRREELFESAISGDE